MFRNAHLYILAMGGLIWHSAGPVRGQETAKSESTAVEELSPETKPFWPTDWMVKAWLNRSINEVVLKHRLSEAQGQNLFDLYNDKLPAFMEKNKEPLQPVLNEMISAALSGVAPGRERTSKLAKVSKPLVKELRGLGQEVFNEFKEDLSSEELVRVTNVMNGFDPAKKFVDRLEQWEAGEFNSSSPPGFHMGFDFGHRSILPPSPWLEKAPSAKPQAAKKREKDRFTQYVEKFVDRYELDKSQQKMAMAILSEFKERAAPAESELAAKISRIEAKERILATRKKSESLSDDDVLKERKALEDHRVVALERVDKLFYGFRKRLQALPTSRQRKQGQVSSR